MKAKKFFVVVLVTLIVVFGLAGSVLAAPAPVFNLDGKVATVQTFKVTQDGVMLDLVLEEDNSTVTLERSGIFVSKSYPIQTMPGKESWSTFENGLYLDANVCATIRLGRFNSRTIRGSIDITGSRVFINSDYNGFLNLTVVPFDDNCSRVPSLE